MKPFAADLRTIYNAVSEEEGRKALDRVNEKWSGKYPNDLKRWYDNYIGIEGCTKAGCLTNPQKETTCFYGQVVFKSFDS